MIRKIKIGSRLFEIRVLDPEISKVVKESPCWDFITSIDGLDKVFVKFGVDRMWISVDSIVIMVKPKTYSLDDIKSIVKSFVSKVTTLHDT